jgi:hypothetical protein
MRSEVFMSKQILALAVLEPHLGKEQDCQNLLRELYDLLKSKGYSRDVLFRESKKDGSPKERFVHLRVWTSSETREEAMQDPDVHKYWIRLPELCSITTIYESLEELYSSYQSSAGASS